MTTTILIKRYKVADSLQFSIQIISLFELFVAWNYSSIFKIYIANSDISFSMDTSCQIYPENQNEFEELLESFFESNNKITCHSEVVEWFSIRIISIIWICRDGIWSDLSSHKTSSRFCNFEVFCHCIMKIIG